MRDRRAGSIFILIAAIVAAAGTSDQRKATRYEFAPGQTLYVKRIEGTKTARSLRATRDGARTIPVRPNDIAQVQWSEVPNDYTHGTVVRVRLATGPSKGRIAWGGWFDFASHEGAWSAAGVSPPPPPRPGEVPAEGGGVRKRRVGSVVILMLSLFTAFGTSVPRREVHVYAPVDIVTVRVDGKLPGAEAPAVRVRAGDRAKVLSLGPVDPSTRTAETVALLLSGPSKGRTIRGGWSQLEPASDLPSAGASSRVGE